MDNEVTCRFCGRKYDLGHVTVTVRYADCSVWNTPCCGNKADDREWKHPPDYYRTMGRATPLIGYSYRQPIYDYGDCDHD